MRKMFVLLALVPFFFMACEDRDDKLFQSQLRIENTANQRFIRVLVGLDSLEFSEIPMESFSPYMPVDTVYFTNAIRIEADSINFVLKPDSLGQPLPRGLYTYRISIAENDSVVVDFSVD